MASNAGIIRDGYAAFARQDIPEVLARFDEGIVWYSPDELPDGGTYRGHDGVVGFFSTLPNHYAELRVETDRFHEAGDCVVVEGHHRGKVLDGTAFDVGFAHVWTMRDGKAVSFREYADTGKLLPLLVSAVGATS